LLLCCCGHAQDLAADEQEPPHLWRQIHAPALFTQGLTQSNGLLYESSGLYGQSSVVIRDLASGRMIRQYRLPAELFAEGLTLHGENLYVLTWKTGKALRLHKDTLQVTAEFDYEGQGWGLTSDSRHLIMSDGSPRLQFRDPVSFKVIHKLQVTHQGHPLPRLNELEWINGFIWANIWQHDIIAVIDPDTGETASLLDFSYLRAKLPASGKAEVLNGIAYLADWQCLLLTGKYWSYFFAVSFPGKPQSCRHNPFLNSQEP